jgi:hypothetical protein
MDDHGFGATKGLAHEISDLGIIDLFNFLFVAVKVLGAE